MSESISQRELRNDSAKILRGLDAGARYIVTRHGQPVGELRPLRRQVFVDSGHLVASFAGAPAIDWDSFRDDVAEALTEFEEPRG